MIASAEGAAESHCVARQGGRWPRDRPPAERAEAGLVLPAGVESPERDNQRCLQGELGRVLTSEVLEKLSATYLRSDDWPSMRCLRELCGPTLCHEWLQVLNRVHGPCLSAEEYMDAVRLCLGVPSQPERCHIRPAGCSFTDMQTRATGESTRATIECVALYFT